MSGDPRRLIGFFNQSTLVSDDDCARIAKACQWQGAADVAPAWGMLSIGAAFYGRESPVPPPPFVERIGFFDDADKAGALGWHTLGPDGKPYGAVFVKPVLDAGGGVLLPSPTSKWTVSAVASHEFIEQYIDGPANMWADGPLQDAGASYALEACDPVEASGYEQDGVSLSNFVYPAYFTPGSAGPYDHLGILTAPFSVAPGGYLIIRSEPGDESSVFGDVRPSEWRLQTKQHPASRTHRRLS